MSNPQAYEHESESDYRPEQIGRLRRAAALIRERAQAAQADELLGYQWSAAVYDDGRAWVRGGDDHAFSLHGYPGAAEHVASWDPIVALGIAEWMESTARYLARGNFPLSRDLHALRVARTYLGDLSTPPGQPADGPA